MQHLPEIRVRVKPAKTMRYATAGDYFERFGMWDFHIAELPNWRMEGLILIHELVEALLTKHAGISWIDIDEFDRFGEGKDSDDPGAMPQAPYHFQHVLAESIERQMADMLEIGWSEYNAALDSLEYKEK